MQGNVIHKIFKRNAYENLLFGWVTALTFNLPSVTVDKAIDQFFSYFKIDEREFTKSNAKTIIARMKTELIDSEKSKNNGNKFQNLS